MPITVTCVMTIMRAVKEPWRGAVSSAPFEIEMSFYV